MPETAIEALRAAVIDGIDFDVVPYFLSSQVIEVLRRASVGTLPGAERRSLKLQRLAELRRALAAEEERWFEWPVRSGLFEWMGVMLDEYVAEVTSEGPPEVLAHRAF